MPTLLNTELWIKFSNIKEIDSQLNREINNSAAGNTVTAVRNKLSPETAENLVIFNDLVDAPRHQTVRHLPGSKKIYIRNLSWVKFQEFFGSVPPSFA